MTEDLSMFEPTCMETLEFYHCLDQLLSRPEAKSHLTWKAIVLITHMTKSKPVLLALRFTLNSSSFSVNFLIA